MTAADKLRELLASRPAMPNTEELVRWWRTSAELVPQVLDERREFLRAAAYAENLVGSVAPEGYSGPDRIRATAQGARRAINAERAAVDVLKQEVRELEQQREAARADLDDARAKLRREQDARAELRLELDRMRPVYEAALRLRAITKRAEQQPTPALLNQQIIDNANAFRELFDAVDAVTSGGSSRMPAGARLLVGDREEPVTVVGRTTDGVTIALLKKGTSPVSIGYLVGEPAARRTFEAGDVVRLRATDSAPAGLPMTIEDVCSFIPGKGIGVRCVWFDDTDNLHRDVFDPSALEHTAPREAARG